MIALRVTAPALTGLVFRDKQRRMPAGNGVQRPNFGLDLIRAGAILSVLFSHTTDWFLGPGNATDILAATVGGNGVEVFFSLSGFLVGSILLRAQRQNEANGTAGGLGPRALARFWGRRWLRTLPAYWVLMLALGWWSGVHDWRSLVFLQNFWPMATWMPLTPHTWSLVLEEWFYLFVPLLVLAVQALLPGRLRNWAVPLACLGLLAGCTALRAAAVLHPNPALWGDNPPINPVLRLDCCAWGVLAAAWVAHRRAPVSARAGLLLTAVGALGLALSGLVSVWAFTPERLAPFGYAHWATGWTITRASLVEGAAVLLLLGLRRLCPTGRGLAAAAVRATAALAYSLYLVHIPMLFLGRIYGADLDHSWPARLAMAAAVFAAAIAMRQLVERPVLALRDRLVPDRPVSGAVHA